MTWQPDASFYPSPRMAMKAPPEGLAYVAAGGAALNGGPQMVEVSRDGRRVYFTNSLYGAVDDQFYPDVLVALAMTGLHSAVMLAATAAAALAVYEILGLAFLRRGWINLDWLWRAALAGAGLWLLLDPPAASPAA